MIFLIFNFRFGVWYDRKWRKRRRNESINHWKCNTRTCLYRFCRSKEMFDTKKLFLQKHMIHLEDPVFLITEVFLDWVKTVYEMVLKSIGSLIWKRALIRKRKINGHKCIRPYTFTIRPYFFSKNSINQTRLLYLPYFKK